MDEQQNQEKPTMQSRAKILHKDVADYLVGKCDRKKLDRIRTIRKQDAVYRLLFDLIDDCKTQTSIIAKKRETFTSDSFSEIERVLLRLYSGQAERREILQFMQALYASPSFYERLLIKMAPAIPEPPPDEVLNEVDVKTDEEILAHVFAEAKHKREPALKLPKPASRWENVSQWLRPRPILAYALLVLFIVTISGGGYLVYDRSFRPDPFGEYSFDDKPPYVYESGLRAPARPSPVDSVYRSFAGYFRRCMVDYVNRDYQSAILNLEKMEPLALTFEARAAATKHWAILRDYYFFLGVSHFAFARSQQTDLDQNTRTDHIQNAITFLNRAETLATRFELKIREREYYFLFLAYGFGGNLELAKDYKQKMKTSNPQSEFYHEKEFERLINEWEDR